MKFVHITTKNGPWFYFPTTAYLFSLEPSCDILLFDKSILFQCERCHPLYRDKLFERGTITKLNPCKKCECNDHADSCYYEPKLDSNPLDRTSKGGGVCQNCKHNTDGRHCNICKDFYFRPASKAVNVPDVCEQCNCYGPGMVKQGSICIKVNSLFHFILFWQ